MPRGRPPVKTLTDSQARILREVESFLQEHSFSPTMRELAERLGMAAQSVSEQLQRLERNGYIQRQPKKVRSLVVLRSAEPQRVSVPRLIAVPIVGTVAAGCPVLSAENICGEVLVEEGVVSSGSHFALKASGRSMIDAGIQPGDIVIVRQQQLAENRDIVVALLNDEATLKRLHYSGGAIELRPENVRFKPILVSPDDDLRILGKVVAIRRAAGK
jgi:repressor LexA